jgi:hypothetical protein
VTTGGLVPSGHGWISVDNSVRQEIGAWDATTHDDGRTFPSPSKSGDPAFWWRKGRQYGGICGHGQVLVQPRARSGKRGGYLQIAVKDLAVVCVNGHLLIHAHPEHAIATRVCCAARTRGPSA